MLLAPLGELLDGEEPLVPLDEPLMPDEEPLIPLEEVPLEEEPVPMLDEPLDADVPDMLTPSALAVSLSSCPVVFRFFDFWKSLNAC